MSSCSPGCKTAFAGKLGIALSDEVQRSGEKDRGQAAEHDRRKHLREELSMRQMHDFRVADRQRNCTLADASGHDRNDDEEEGVISPKSQHHADGRANGSCDDRTDRKGYEYLEKTLDEDLAVHAQDAADDNRRDKQVQEVGKLGEVDDQLQDRLGKQMIISKAPME